MGAVKGPKRFACRKPDRLHWNRLWVPGAVYASNLCIPQVWGRFRWNRLWDPIMLSGAKLVFLQGWGGWGSVPLEHLLGSALAGRRKHYFPLGLGWFQGNRLQYPLALGGASFINPQFRLKNLHNRSFGGCENGSFHNLRQKKLRRL